MVASVVGDALAPRGARHFQELDGLLLHADERELGLELHVLLPSIANVRQLVAILDDNRVNASKFHVERLLVVHQLRNFFVRLRANRVGDAADVLSASLSCVRYSDTVFLKADISLMA